MAEIIWASLAPSAIFYVPNRPAGHDLCPGMAIIYVSRYRKSFGGHEPVAIIYVRHQTPETARPLWGTFVVRGLTP